MRQESRKREILIALMLISSMLLFSSCSVLREIFPARETTELTSDIAEEPDAFDDYCDELFCGFVSVDQFVLHSYLIDPSAYDISVPEAPLAEVSTENYENYYDSLQEALDTLSEFDYNSLADEQKITYDTLKTFLEGELGVREDYLLNDPILDGDYNNISFELDLFSIEDKDDIEMYLNILDSVDEYLASVADFESEKSEAGYFMTSSQAASAISSCDYVVRTDGEEFITDFNVRIRSCDWLTLDEKNDYIDRNNECVVDSVIPGYKLLRERLLQLKGTGTDEIGYSSYEGGKDFYTWELQKSTATNLTPDEIYAILDDTLTTWEKEYSILYIQNKDADYMKKFDDFTTPDEVIENNLEKMEEDYPMLEELPSDYCVQLPLPEEYSDYAGMYCGPQLDNIWGNTYYVSEDWSSGFGLYATASHECIPGHLYQTEYLLQSDAANLPILFYFFTEGDALGAQEGWTTYIERETYEYAGITEDQAEEELLDDLIYYAYMEMGDIALNYYGWTEAEFTENMTKADHVIYLDYSSDIYETAENSPTAYASYVVGYIEVAALREKAEEALGSNFNLKDFHTFYLDMGGTYFDITEKYLDAWIEEQE